MKKVLAMVLALVMVLSLGTVALAAGAGINGNTEGDIIVNVTGGNVNHTRCIIIEWGNLVFSYSKGDKTWNPETKEYDEAAGKWVGGNTATVTVTNKSDVNVAVGVAITGGSEEDGFEAGVDTAHFVLDSYVDRTAADSRVITVTVGVAADEPEVEAAERIEVGTVALTIS